MDPNKTKTEYRVEIVKNKEGQWIARLIRNVEKAMERVTPHYVEA